jgi:hypothetical protein
VLAFLATPVQCPHVAGFAPTTSARRFGDRRVLLAVRVGLRPAGQRGVRRRPLDEALLLLTVVGLAAVLLHQLLTDRVCHGSCSLTPTPSGRPS